MNKKPTQRDLCVLFLAEQDRWIRAVEMKGKEFGKSFLGSESDRRMMEVMDDVRKRGFYEIGSQRYVIEEGREGKFKMYRIANAFKKPVTDYQLFFENGRAIRRPVLITQPA